MHAHVVIIITKNIIIIMINISTYQIENTILCIVAIIHKCLFTFLPDVVIASRIHVYATSFQETITSVLEAIALSRFCAARCDLVISPRLLCQNYEQQHFVVDTKKKVLI